MQDDLKKKAEKIKLVLMDVDGVMTDGKIVFASNGIEVKQFDAKDGIGIKIAQRFGIKFGLITGRVSEAVARRAEELGIEEVHQGALRKINSYNEIVKRLSLKDEDVSFIGDDVVDIPILRRVGLPVAVADAHPDVLPHAIYRTTCRGGHGAIREVIDIIIRAQGKWDEMIKRYL